MPEIAEIARVVHFLRKYAVGRIVKTVKTQEDTIVYGKVGTSTAEFEQAMTGKRIIDAKQQGKYFWLEMESAPHPLMHLGMSGWMKFSNDDTAYYRPAKSGEADWPPKFWKFVLGLEGDPKCEIAFVDARRLGRIRLVDAKAEEMRKTTPLKENGPDPVLDSDVLTVEWLSKKLSSKKVPVKALLLNQANISGIGNWVGDEIMYQARLHPEQYSNTFTDAQVKQLHDAMMYVCNTAVDALAESEKFPSDWLMKHRWDKGKKNGGKLPNGDKVTFLTVGGRTSAVVPSVQKKTGTVAGDVSGEIDDVSEEETKPKKGERKESKAKKEEEGEEETKPKKGGRKKSKAKKEEEGEESEPEKLPKSTKRGRKKVEEEVKAEGEEEEEEAPVAKKQKPAANGSKLKGRKGEAESMKTEDTGGRRRSGRLSKD
ncbi:hypothetical protein P280DRAFT_456786 [Massarina eburnea CBS 473.64]|uniref:Formamidopyrimidine-DNA glycosylase catalytic domain-containing protein n=1 Tax=Massarina eburnea CBS 473.64 TaxID=1395130 RepID=A0A6A6RTJ7_9PLEO|nr:hypothetical protein P280DRAFT_456786 [Massarina eburnea CBS 473.64]